MKYRVKNTTLKHNNLLFLEGSIIELSDEEAKELEHVLEKIEEEEDKNIEEKKNKGGKK